MGIFQSAYWRGAVVAPLLVLALLLPGGLWLIGESIWTHVTRRQGPLTRLLTVILGDAWAYSDPRICGDVLDHLAERVAFASSRANRVVVVGHSQGAALSRLLTGACSFDALVTVGSGANYLGAARRRRIGRVLYGWTLTISYGVFLSLVLHLGVTTIASDIAEGVHHLRAVWDATLPAFSGNPQPDLLSDAVSDDHWLPLASAFDPLARLGLAMVVLGVVATRLIRVDEPSPDWGQPLVDHWVDIASIYDPVCVGGAGGAEADVTVAVVNTHHTYGVLKEHTEYFENPDVGDAIRRTIVEAPLESRHVDPTDRLYLLRWSWAWGLLPTLALAYLGPIGLARKLAQVWELMAGVA